LDDGVTAIATDVERLVVSLEASAKKFESAMTRAAGLTNTSMRQVERRTEQAANRITQSFSRAGTAVRTGLAGVFAGLSVQQIAQFSDSFTKIQNSLKVAGLEGQALRKTYEELYAISQRQAAPLEAMATLYGRLSTAQKELNVSGSEMLRFTELVGMALRVSGTGAQEASGALLQLSQALGGGKIQAEEYNSLLDGARPLLQAVAAGMVETGGSVAKLTALVKEGKVSSEAFFRAALAGYPLLEKQSASAGTTMSQSMGKARDALTNLIGKIDESLTASNQASGGVNSFAAGIDAIANAVPGAMNALNDLYTRMTEIGNSDVFKNVNEWLASKGLSGMNGVTPVSRFDQVFGAKANAGSMAGYKPGARPAPVATPTISPIRNADYGVPGDDKSTGRGGGKSSAERVNELQRETQAIQERTRALGAELQTIGLSAGETAKAEAAFRLLEAAKEANVAVTPQLKAQIDSLAAAYGEATQKIEDAQKAQEAVADAAQEVGSMLSNAFQDAILEGEELDQVLQKLAKSLASKAFDNIFANLFGGAGGQGGGLFDGIFKSLFAPGRAMGGSVSAGQPYTVGENGRELFVPTTPGKIIPNSKLGGGGMQVQIFNNAGAQVSTKQTQGPQGPRLEVQIEQMLDGMIAGGRLDKSLKGRFGVNPMRGR
jgi:tape measure domain-containing protein